MRVQVEADHITYDSRRLAGSAELKGRYQPIGPVQIRQRGSLEYWLSERYCLYTTYRSRLYRCEIHHAPWPLQDADAQFQKNTMAAHVDLPELKPLLHFSKRQEVLIWPLTRVT